MTYAGETIERTDTGYTVATIPHTGEFTTLADAMEFIRKLYLGCGR